MRKLINKNGDKKHKPKSEIGIYFTYFSFVRVTIKLNELHFIVLNPSPIRLNNMQKRMDNVYSSTTTFTVKIGLALINFTKWTAFYQSVDNCCMAQYKQYNMVLASENTKALCSMSVIVVYYYEYVHILVTYIGSCVSCRLTDIIVTVQSRP